MQFDWLLASQMSMDFQMVLLHQCINNDGSHFGHHLGFLKIMSHFLINQALQKGLDMYKKRISNNEKVSAKKCT